MHNSDPASSIIPKYSTTKRPFPCTTCRSRFVSQENLEAHQLLHQSDGILKCSICEKHFDNVQALIAHNKVHQTKKTLKCQLCDVWFKTSGNLKEHMKVHKGLVFKCSHCGKDFNKIGNLRLHEQRHTGSLKEFKCNICPRTFSQRCLLKYHMRIHNGDRPFKCDVCSSAFADKSNLKKHFRIHSGEKPFSCEQCDKTFNQKSSLTCHRRTHVTFKPHECQHCGKRFGLNEELTVHLRVHGENKMFKCHICDDEFTEHCFLKSHMRIHDLKTAGNKSVLVYKSSDIDADEPTCLMPVDGDTNVLKSIVLKKRQRNGRTKNSRRNDDNVQWCVESEKPIHEDVAAISGHDRAMKIEEDNKACVSKEFINEMPQILPHVTSVLEMQIKEEYDDTAIPFVNVPIKIEEPDDFNDDSYGCNKLEFNSQPTDSDSDDSDERMDWKRLLEIHLKRTTAVNPMDQFKHIIQSTFPIVLVERLPYFLIDHQYDVTNTDINSTQYKDKAFTTSTTDKNDKITLPRRKRSIVRYEECSQCSKKLTSWPKLLLHEQTHRQTFDCPTCKLDCSNRDNFVKHINESKKCSRKIYLNRKLMCSLCDNGVRYKNQIALDYHVTKHTGLRPFVCDVCQKTFRSRETLRHHMDYHAAVTNFNCEFCGRGFPNKNHLKQHQLSHTDLKPFQCDVCHNFFKSQGRLYNHKKIHMKPQYSCCYCSKEFTIVGNLKIHEMRHMSSDLINKFECNICGKQFILKHDLRYHMRKHNGERPYPCSMCPSRFADISNLHKHVKIHTGAKPFVCDCGKSYNQQSSLNTHKKTHLIATSSKTFSCTHCPNKFALEEDLTQHLRIHGIESMFKCNFCDKEYELLNHMKSHRRIHLNLKLKRNRFIWPESVDKSDNNEVKKASGSVSLHMLDTQSSQVKSSNNEVKKESGSVPLHILDIQSSQVKSSNNEVKRECES